MTTRRLHTSAFFLLVTAIFAFLPACTEKRDIPKAATLRPRRAISDPFTAVAEVKFQEKDMVTLQMQRKGSYLYVTGRPFGFTKWDIAADPEAPNLVFAASDNINTFVPTGNWVVDYFAGTALAILGNYAYMSGAVGTSAVDISLNDTPVERGRYPYQDPNAEDIVKDPEGAYSYRAIAAHPRVPVVYGFREQDFVYTLKANGARLQPIRKDAYGPSGVCCVRGATVFRNRLFVAFRSAIWMFDMADNGTLSEPIVLDSLQAAGVAASDNFLYVYHLPTYSTSAGSTRPAGIYVFDETGEQVAFMSIPEIYQFSPSANDDHLYVNQDNASVTIYKTTWRYGTTNKPASYPDASTTSSSTSSSTSTRSPNY